MKILMINGSPKARGNTSIALREMDRSSPKRGSRLNCFILGGRISGAALPVVGAPKRASASLTTW